MEPNKPVENVVKKSRRKFSIRRRNNSGKFSIRLSLRTFLIISMLVALSIGSAVYFYKKNQDSQNKLNNPDQLVKSETQALISKISLLTELPNGEDPTVATVSDVSKLSDQTFFANAKNGDKVLIYTKAKKAYLYRPTTNQIINIAPLNVDSPKPASNTQPTQ